MDKPMNIFEETYLRCIKEQVEDPRTIKEQNLDIDTKEDSSGQPKEFLDNLLANKNEDNNENDPSRRKYGRNISKAIKAMLRLTFDNYDFLPVELPIAQDPSTSAKKLQILAAKGIWLVRLAVAQNPNTPIETLIELAKDKRSDVRWSVAMNPKTPAETLANLAKDETDFVRHGVTQNSNAPANVLNELSKDEDADIRYAVALNPNTSPETLTELEKDEIEFVRDAVKKLENTN